MDVPQLGFEGPAPGAGASYGLEELVRKDPQFSIGRVQYALPSSLLALACANNVLVLLVAGSSSQPPLPPRIIRIDLASPEKDRQVDLYTVAGSNPGSASGRGTSQPPAAAAAAAAAPSSDAHQLFLDPSGRHILVSTSSGDNYYFYSGWEAHVRRAKALTKLKGVAVSAVAWNVPQAQAGSQGGASTREILLGDLRGNIYECVLDGSAGGDADIPVAAALRNFGRGGAPERYLKLVYTLPRTSEDDGSAAVTGLWAEPRQEGSVQSGQSSSKRGALVLATTASQLYQFVGTVPSYAAQSAGDRDEGSVYDDFFKQYRDVLPKFMELPGSPRSSQLLVWQSTQASKLRAAEAMAWLTGPGVYYGRISAASTAAGDGVVEEAQLLPHPHGAEVAADGAADAGEPPVSLALTAHHLLFLYPHRLRVVRIVDNFCVYDQRIELATGEVAQKIVTDVVCKTYWIHSTTSIFEMSIKEETRDLWKVHLDRQAFDQALRFASTSSVRRLVYSAQARSLIQQGRFIQAAEAYASSDTSFESVVLTFMQHAESDALRFYLSRCLEKLKRTDPSQRLMLATWLVELYLSKLSQLEDISASESVSDDVENYHVERAIIEDDLKQFLEQYKSDLDRKTTYGLIDSHGRVDIALHYARAVKDSNRILCHGLAERDWQLCLKTLANMKETADFHKHVPLLLRNVPEDTVGLLLRRPDVRCRKLLPAFLQFATTGGAGASHSLRYLKDAIFRKHDIDAAVHNAVVHLLALTEKDGEAALLEFLRSSPRDPLSRQPYYDVDQALRLCKSRHKVRSTIHILTIMDRPDSAVEVALRAGDIELAKATVRDAREDRALKKRLWLQIAKHIVRNKADLSTVLLLLDEAADLKIEDVLPFFPDFTVIDDFKEDICLALERYSDKIEALKVEMQTAAEVTEHIKHEVSELQSRFVVVDSGAACDTCGAALLNRQFYVFPCQHSFHADCLVKEVTQHLQPTALRRILELQNAITSAKTVSEFDPQGRARRFASQEGDAFVTTRKIAQASVQGLDALRKLVVPDALVAAIGGTFSGSLGSRPDGIAVSNKDHSPEALVQRNRNEQTRRELDRLLAGTCALCDTALVSLDRPFLTELEMELQL